MILGFNELKELVQGYVCCAEQDGYAFFCRYTEEQAQKFLTDVKSEDFYIKTFASSGIRLELRTDAQVLAFSYKGKKGSSRKLCYFDLCVDGALLDSKGGELEETEFEGSYSFALPAGEKRVALYLPNLQSVRLGEVTLEGASFAEPVQKARKLLCFGDSITQGYTTRYPSLSYANHLADRLDAEVVNKGIGGDRFNPYILEVDDGYRPDIVTVAYGTNDWSRMKNEGWSEESKAQFADAHTAFIRSLSERYADARLFVVTPIWRGNADESFYAHCDVIRATAEQYPSVTVIDGLSLLGRVKDFYEGDVLHPNDLGHALYGEQLAEEIKKLLHF